jgi:hypothetical protein
MSKPNETDKLSEYLDRVVRQETINTLKGKDNVPSKETSDKPKA